MGGCGRSPRYPDLRWTRTHASLGMRGQSSNELLVIPWMIATGDGPTLVLALTRDNWLWPDRYGCFERESTRCARTRSVYIAHGCHRGGRWPWLKVKGMSGRALQGMAILGV